MPELDNFTIVILCLIITLLAIALTTFLVGTRQKEPPLQIQLRDLKVIWKEDGTGELSVSDLAPKWRNEEVLAKGPDYKSLLFHNPRIAGFVEKQLRHATWFQNASLQANVAVAILSMLDNEGGCPSVVNVAGDVEAKWDRSTYSTLAEVTLCDHTLNVATETVAALLESGAAHIIPDALVAALGHDLGKLPSAQGYLYSLGEHPLAAGKALSAIPDFCKLGKKDEILRAIKMHHKMPDGLLSKTIKTADQKARQKETEERLLEAKQNGQKETSQTKSQENPQPSPQPSPAASPKPTADGNAAAAWAAEQAIYGTDSAAPRSRKNIDPATLEMIDISSWFDAQEFLEMLRPYINKLFGKRMWKAFSMSNGFVYIQAKCLEEVARRQAEAAGIMEIATMAPGDESMRRVLFTIVHKLRVEHQDVIARELIQAEFFGGYFILTTNAGRRFRGFYTPFHAEAFGSIAEMEAAKDGILLSFKSVGPDTETATS